MLSPGEEVRQRKNCQPDALTAHNTVFALSPGVNAELYAGKSGSRDLPYANFSLRFGRFLLKVADFSLRFTDFWLRVGGARLRVGEIVPGGDGLPLFGGESHHSE